MLDVIDDTKEGNGSYPHKKLGCFGLAAIAFVLAGKQIYDFIHRNKYPGNGYNVQFVDGKYRTRFSLPYSHYEGAGAGKDNVSFDVSLIPDKDSLIVKVDNSTCKVGNINQAIKFVADHIKKEEGQRTSSSEIDLDAIRTLKDAYDYNRFAAEDSLAKFRVSEIKDEDQYIVDIVFKDGTTIKTIKNGLFSRLEKFFGASIEESSISLDSYSIHLVLVKNKGSEGGKDKNK